MRLRGLPFTLLLTPLATGFAGAVSVERFAMHEVAFTAAGHYANPYTDLGADAVLTEPDGRATRSIPLFWDGGSTWKFRFAPDRVGGWKWSVKSADQGLAGKSGAFECVASQRKGGLQPMPGHPLHFARQDGSPFWFMGDTAWALYTDNLEERHDRAAAQRYIDARAAQGFNVLHSMLLAESGWGNAGGPPFTNIQGEQLNPGYWAEVDTRLAHANRQGLVCGLALAWGDKRKVEPFAWRRFPSLEARKRYARYSAARYSAFDVYFLVSGEWHGEIRTRGSSEEAVRREFMEIGDTLRGADPHGRLVAIHPMTRGGSVREFNAAQWMGFGDYQQNYTDLHARILESRALNKPVVNSEYGYHLRDQSGDGVPDKANSTSLEAIRHASWDIVMAGGYLVTGFGTTYFGGNRDPGPFDLDAARNKPWEQQIGQIQRLFRTLEWWKLQSHDELVRCATPRGGDRTELKQTAPPKTTYWCLAEPARRHVVYLRGLEEAVDLSLQGGKGRFRARQFNPRSGEFDELNTAGGGEVFRYQPPDAQDWVVLVEAVGLEAGGPATPALAQPRPGDVFREYTWSKPGGDAGGSLRVGGKVGYDGNPIEIPHSLDLEHATRAEVVIEKLLCHDGTRGLAISVNGGEWLAVPEAPGIAPPPWEYQHFTFPVVPLPVAGLKAGSGNTFALRVNDEHPWKWPQNLIYGVHFRIYYDAARKPHPTGRITAPAAGGTLGRRVEIRAEAASPNSRVRQVDFLGLYDGVNWEGDGAYRQWHHHYFQGRLTNHLGAATAPPWRITWDTSWVPDQPEPVQLAARITDESGLTFLTEPVGGLALGRPGLSVELCKPWDVPKKWVTRSGEHAERFRVAGDPRQATAAQLVWSSWSPGYMNGVFINDRKVFDSEGPRYTCYWHRVPLVDLSVLKAGENVLKTGLTPRHNGKMVHGMEVNWPGVMVLIQYEAKP